METKWLIEVNTIGPAFYYAGYEVRDKQNCPSGETEAVLHKFTEDVYTAKHYPSKRLAEDILRNLPSAIQTVCTISDHGFGT